MLTRNITTFFTVVVIFLFAEISITYAQVIEESLHIPGTTEGTGKLFEITDSEYLNITLESSEDITTRIESASEMIVLDIRESIGAQVSQFILSGFLPNTIYHKYQDDYHNYEPLIIDENGTVSFNQDLTQDHFVFIQPQKSTKFIKDDATGGDCESIGNWSASSKTCAFNKNTSETIQIDNDNITLDGNGYTMAGTSAINGIYFSNKKRITIKNITISGFSSGISFYSSSSENKIDSVILKNNRNGIYMQNSGKNIISNSTITQNADSGIKLYYATGNTISNNIIGPENKYGIFQQWPNYNNSITGNIYANNNVSGNYHTGIYTYYGKSDVLNNNIVNNNLDTGISIVGGDSEKLFGNAMSGNHKVNFFALGGNMATNDINTSNLVEGKSIYYLKNVSDTNYDGNDDIGTFYCINCANIILKNVSLPENKAQIFFQNVNNSLIENVTSLDKNIEVFLYYSNSNLIRKNTFGKIYLANSNDNKIYNNNLMNTSGTIAQADFSERNLFNLDLPVGGNYWKKYASSCRDSNGDGICDNPLVIGQKIIDNYPWVKEFDFSQPSCCSSVMFLPGHQASRLYRKDGDDEDQLWEPTNHNEDVKQLYMDSDGESIDPEIYTREVVDEVYGLADNVYKGFISSMNQFVTDGAINEWKPIPYDWRLPLEKIAEDGVEFENGWQMDIIDEIRRMAAASKTGKVTLIGHSNGGLLAKTLIDKLKESGNEKLIDRLIMVGTPQLGTPKAMAALLHGDETSLLHGLILDKKTGRGFAENMESAYNLLPSQKYFDAVQSPVVKFDDDVKEIYDFRSLYGEDIDNWNEFKKFLLGDDGARIDPEFNDTDSPNVLREVLLNQTDATHDKLDDWQSPEGIEVVQIAGWGLDTISGIKYDDCDFIFCPDKLSNLDRSLIMTVDGDETVVVPSAVEMGGNAERYYLNVKEYNENNRIFINADHASILEIESLQNFIKNIIKGDKTLTEYLSTEKPEVEDEDKRLRFRLHSPVSLDLYDEDGKHTGLVKNNSSDLRLYEEQIPNSYYTEFGEIKYAGSGDSPINIILTGEDLGTFTFEIDQVAGDTVAQSIAFANIPVMKDMRATLSVSETVSEMKIDVDNDGQIDATFQPGEEIKKEALLGIFEKIINSLNVDATVKDRLINKIDNAKKQMEKGHSISANAMLENVKQQINNFSDEETPKKFHIVKEEAEKLLMIIDRIQTIE